MYRSRLHPTEPVGISGFYAPSNKLSIDFKQLANQKAIFLDMVEDWARSNSILQNKSAEEVAGLLGLLDSIQDQAVEKGYATEEEVFGEKFPNGFSSWRETHFEVVSAISRISRQYFPDGKVKEVEENYGIGGLYDLADELTDKFERINAEKVWDGDFFDEVESFLEKELGY